MHRVFLSLGSNIGDRNKYLRKAAKLLSSEHDKIIGKSSVYETEPWGFANQRKFFNQVIEMETLSEPLPLLEIIHKIEVLCGRKPSAERYGPRPIDIDILFFDRLIMKTETLEIPHPLIPARLFVLVPMAEIASDFIHPAYGKTIVQLLAQCKDEMKVVRIS